MSSENISISQYEKTIIVNGYATEAITRESLDRWADDLTYVSCYSYGFNAKGELIPMDDEELIQSAFDSGIAPLMVLTPFTETGEYSYELARVIFTTPAIRDRLINNVVLTATEKNYYGVVINFGAIATDDRDQFVITVSKTAARMNRRGKLVIVSIVPGVNDEGIDYESLSKAANFLELRMFYWEQANDPPSAVSPIDKVREKLAYMITIINAHNILLGLSNYGFDWRLPFAQGAPAEIIPHIEAAERAQRMGAMVNYNEALQSPYFNYINLTGSTHEVWYEDARSMRVKLDLVYEYDLAGVSIWTIMNPFPGFSEALNQLFTVFKV